MVVHDVLADEANRYEPHDKVCAGGVEQARDVDLWLTIDRCGVAVDRLPGRAPYPAATRINAPIHAPPRTSGTLPCQLPLPVHRVCLQPPAGATRTGSGTSAFCNAEP